MTNFWIGKKVFLTGHTGFKGSWTALLLTELGARVFGYSDLVPTSPSLFDLASIGDRIEDSRGDVVDFQSLTEAMCACRPDVVIHMAAQSIVKDGYINPRRTYATNLMGTVNVLEAARLQSDVGVVLIVTTDKCYDNKEWHWSYREIDELGGHDPYSSSKACAELAASSFRRSFFSAPERHVAIMTARAGNVIGGGDFMANRVVPDTFRAFSSGVPLKVRNPNAVRPWQHVLDPVWGYLTLIENAWEKRSAYSEPWNFGPGAQNEKSVAALVAGMASRWGGHASWVHEFNNHFKEAQILRIDASKAADRIGWRPVLGFEDMLNWTAKWYQQFASGHDPFALTIQQISEYLKLIAASEARVNNA